MPKFRVTVQRRLIERVTLTVQADNEEKACDIAELDAHHGIDTPWKEHDCDVEAIDSEEM
jgi:hypothetical protein